LEDYLAGEAHGFLIGFILMALLVVGKNNAA
jgi:biotin transporter BioY